MAKIAGLVGGGLWGRLAKCIDFYYWKGILVARTMPTRCKQPGTDRQKRTWGVFLSRWIRIRLLEQMDKMMMNNWGSSGDKTWTDVWSRWFMHAENVTPGRWNTIYGLKVDRVFGSVQVCARAERPGVATLWGREDRLGKEGPPVRWCPDNECPTPPTKTKRTLMEMRGFTAVASFPFGEDGSGCVAVPMPVGVEVMWLFISFGSDYKDLGGGIGGLLCVRR